VGSKLPQFYNSYHTRDTVPPRFDPLTLKFAEVFSFWIVQVVYHSTYRVTV
jgi:hypothetical protein